MILDWYCSNKFFAAIQSIHSLSLIYKIRAEVDRRIKTVSLETNFLLIGQCSAKVKFGS